MPQYHVTAMVWVEAEDKEAAESYVEDALMKSKHVTELDMVEAEED
jgi:hypothetical protein